MVQFLLDQELGEFEPTEKCYDSNLEELLLLLTEIILVFCLQSNEKHFQNANQLEILNSFLIEIVFNRA